MKRKLQRALLARALSRAPRAPLFAPEDTPGGGGGAGAGAGTAPAGNAPGVDKTFTQADVDRISGQVRADVAKKFSDYDKLKERAQKADETEAELNKLKEEAADKGKSAEERERAQAERAAKKLDQERTEAAGKLAASEQRAEAAEKRYRTKVIEGALGEGLDASKVLPSARAKAIKALHEDSKVELDEDGAVTAITYGGVAYKSVAEAAGAFLKENDFFAQGTVPAGGGTKRPGGGSPTTPVVLYDKSPHELLQIDAERRRAGG